MNTKKKILFSFVGLILSITVFATVVLAWFAISSVTSDFVVETGNLETDTTLYYGDWDSESSKYTWVEVGDQDDANKIFQNFIPGQILTFKLQISNLSESTIKAQYSAKFGKIMYLD